MGALLLQFGICGRKGISRNILKNWLDKLKGDSDLDWNDCYISFMDNKRKKFQRFHHAFTKKELKKLFPGLALR